MKKLLFLSAFIILALISYFYFYPSLDTNNLYNVGDNKVVLPSSYLVAQKKYISSDWSPNGYCDQIENIEKADCNLLVVSEKSSPESGNFIISYPLQFGILVSDAQECFKENIRTIENGNKKIQYIEYYHNINEITYHNENIELGKSPYNCDQISISANNFHHAKGCSNGFCIWADKEFGLERLNKAIEQLEIK